MTLVTVFCSHILSGECLLPAEIGGSKAEDRDKAPALRAQPASAFYLHFIVQPIGRVSVTAGSSSVRAASRASLR